MSILSTPVMTAKQKPAEGPDLACDFKSKGAGKLGTQSLLLQNSIIGV